MSWRKFGFRHVWKYDEQILYKDNNDKNQKIKIYYEQNFLLFSLRGSENRIFISGKFGTFKNATLMPKVICKTLLILFLFLNYFFSLYTQNYSLVKVYY